MFRPEIWYGTGKIAFFEDSQGYQCPRIWRNTILYLSANIGFGLNDRLIDLSRVWKAFEKFKIWLIGSVYANSERLAGRIADTFCAQMGVRDRNDPTSGLASPYDAFSNALFQIRLKSHSSGLVLGCIEADFCKWMLILRQFSTFTTGARFAQFWTSDRVCNYVFFCHTCAFFNFCQSCSLSLGIAAVHDFSCAASSCGLRFALFSPAYLWSVILLRWSRFSYFLFELPTFSLFFRWDFLCG